ncbi:DUF1775 domain-containing protein [Streptomyces sp. NPDC046984]|uniref:DUF1775 domain-containing protein n=1 Tax=Streptomyces sp. NPDC046984 TaxID=3155138 RepID=UPI0033CFA8C6
MTFNPLQAYSDGKTVRWIEEAQQGGDEPGNPVPVLKLTAKRAEEGGGTSVLSSASSKDPDGSESATSTSDSTVRGLGVVGLAVGLLDLGAAVLADLCSRSAGTRFE